MPPREPREITESFRIERVLKSSRSGIVFRALDPTSGEPVAIKLIPAPPSVGAATSQARFVALSELLVLLQPPGIPPLRDFGFTPDGGAFLVMDFIEGARLDRIADLAPARAIAIVLPVLDALATLAAKGLHHGNVSPDNVLVGSGERVWLVGLGSAALRPVGTLARAILDDESSRFAAPECFAADGALAAEDWRADLYSSALTLCSLLHAEVTDADEPAPAVQLPAGVAAALQNVGELRAALEQMLRRNPLERPASFDEVRDAFRRALGVPTAVPGGDRRSRRQPASASHPGTAAGEAPAVPASDPPQTPAPVAAPGPPPALPANAADADWEEPEGAPAWLQESQLQVVPQVPEPRLPEPAPAEPHDEREDTNPVPLQRRAELPAVAHAEPPTPAPTVGAPAPLPTPVIVPAPPVPAPAIQTAVPAVQPPDSAEPAPPARRTAPGTTAPARPPSAANGPAALPPPVASATVPPPPAAVQAPPPAAPAAALRPDQRQAVVIPAAVRAAAAVSSPPRSVVATPPTGSFPVPADAGPAAVSPPPADAAFAPAPASGQAAAAAEPRPEEPPKAPAPQPAKATPRAKRPRLGPLLGGAAVVLVIVTGAVVGLRMATTRRAPAAAPQPVPTRPRPTAVPLPTVSQAALENLLAAEEAAAAGDIAAARAAIEAISADDELAFGPAELGRLTGVRAAVSRVHRQQILGDLQQALANGNLRVARDALRRLTREDEAALAGDPDAAQTFDEARRAINLLNLATKAQQAGNNALALEHGAALAALAPRSSQAVELREKAAAALERDAEVLAGRGQFELARERLDTVARHWSARPGLAQRIERMRTAEANDQRLAGILAEADRAAVERRPDHGLELLRSVAPPPYLEQRFRDARARLDAVMREIDANPPGLDLPSTLKLEYSRNKPFVLVVRITDDHAVKSAALFLRVKEAEHYKELALRRTQENEWSGEITTPLHENKTVEFYVVATDHSGHTGQLGSPQQPLTLKKKWGIFGR